MLRPSYSELMDQLNEDVELDSKITSRYTIVIAAAKRARQIINGAPCDKTGSKTDKAVSIAVSEMSRGQIKIFPEGLPEEEAYLDDAADGFSSDSPINTSDNFKDVDTGFDDSIFEDDDFDDDFDGDDGYDVDYDDFGDEDSDGEESY